MGGCDGRERMGNGLKGCVNENEMVGIEWGDEMRGMRKKDGENWDTCVGSVVCLEVGDLVVGLAAAAVEALEGSCVAGGLALS